MKCLFVPCVHMALLVMLLTGCTHNKPPVEESMVVTAHARGKTAQTVPEFHRVQRGDTLYSIAFRYGLDFRALADMNGIVEPYTIYPGRKLVLRKQGLAPAVASRPAGAKPVVAKSAMKPTDTGVAARINVVDSLQMAVDVPWQWPVPGKVIGLFNPNGIGPKGIALDGKPGEPVRAGRDGRVVYVGGSLVGYGQLVILKHDDVYLSAYAHNSKVLVKEGATVRAGETIAEMGASGTDRTRLHFEVRRNGDPIDPLLVLPRR